MHNPNSAVERIKNHLAYKLGQAMIEYNKNGGGYLSLFKKLYNIKKQHKKEKQIYQETIKVFPTLKYPELKQCPDYNEALKCYFHLSYMLGEVLNKTFKTWYKGSIFTLAKNIKKANKEFKLFQNIFKEFDQINSTIFENLLNNKQLFLKEFPKIKNLLNIHKDYKPIIDNIFHNFDYVTKNFNLIEEWLLSNDFNEKYKKENHPYPSLLDPKKLNDEKEKINYKTIPAELAWEMNLPLPDNYEFVF
ncbi:sugar transferase, partial [Campylobacter sp. W0047]|nr:sugar transferase [Campylobacter sp. W0047]